MDLQPPRSRDGEDHAARDAGVGCMAMTREKFLNEFLGALGAVDLIFTEIGEDRICGTAIFNHRISNENQAFCWHITNSNLPSKEIYNLARLIREQKLLSIDKIIVSRDELRKRYNERWDLEVTVDEFSLIIETLESIEVSMVDDGEEYDAFFIHE